MPTDIPIPARLLAFGIGRVLFVRIAFAEHAVKRGPADAEEFCRLNLVAAHLVK